MKLLIYCVAAAYYLLMALRLFYVWRNFLQRDTSLSSRPKQLYFRLVGITILWPLIVPFAYLELLHKTKSEVTAFNPHAPDEVDEVDGKKIEVSSSNNKALN